MAVIPIKLSYVGFCGNHTDVDNRGMELRQGNLSSVVSWGFVWTLIAGLTPVLGLHWKLFKVSRNFESCKN